MNRRLVEVAIYNIIYNFIIYSEMKLYLFGLEGELSSEHDTVILWNRKVNEREVKRDWESQLR